MAPQAAHASYEGCAPFYARLSVFNWHIAICTLSGSVPLYFTCRRRQLAECRNTAWEIVTCVPPVLSLCNKFLNCYISRLWCIYGGVWWTSLAETYAHYGLFLSVLSHLVFKIVSGLFSYAAVCVCVIANYHIPHKYGLYHLPTLPAICLYKCKWTL